MNHINSGKFEEDIQYVSEEFIFPEEPRRQIFSPLTANTTSKAQKKRSLTIKLLNLLKVPHSYSTMG